MKSIQSALFSIILFSLGTSWAATAPSVVVSITPFYALVAAVMKGVGTPKLLVKPGASPHEYALRPSDILLLQDAELIFWGGPQLETFLVKPLNTLKAHSEAHHIVEFDNVSGLLLLPIRHSAAWDPHEHEHENGHTHEILDNDKSNQDMHFWLNPNNAIILTDMIVYHLVMIDPEHTHIYKKNGTQLKKRLKKLDAHIATELETVKAIPYIVFHDAYQYVEQRYGLKGVGSITLNPEIPPSAKRLNTIRITIEKSKAQCIFREPQFQPKLVDSIVVDLGIKTGELDPIGQAPQNNAEGYFTLLENLSHALKQCLGSARNEHK